MAAAVRCIVAADYSQLELRVAAALSKDPQLCGVFQHDPDSPEGNVHAATTSMLFGMPIDQAKEQKALYHVGKTLNFLTLYGGQEGKARELLEKTIIEQELDMPIPSRREIKSWIQRHQDHYQGYWQWARRTVQQAKQDGFSRTWGGRIRLLPEFTDGRASEGERVAVNHAVQGTAAEIVKAAMVRVHREQADPESPLSHGDILLQVHDELVCSVAEEVVAEYIQRLRCLMGGDFLGVQLAVTIGWGKTWADAH